MLKLRGVIEGEEKLFPLVGEEVRLGRGSDNDVVLSDFSVSRRHAAVRREPEGWFLYDLMSTNGVQVNGVTVKKGAIRTGDHVKIGTFEFDVVGEGEPAASGAPTPPKPSLSASSSGISSATIVRPLAEFSADYGLDGGSAEGREATNRLDKRKALEQAYANKIFGFLTRLARMLITSDKVDDVLSRVMEIAFEALPVDRGFILLRDEPGSEPVCELARLKDRVEFRPQAEVPVSKTMVETVMNQRVALLTYDALSDQRLAGGDSIRIHQIRAAMCAPLWSGERIIGVMQVDSPFHVGTFTEQDLDLLTALANYAAVAVERIRYAAKAETERRVRGRLERYHSPAVIEEVMREGGAVQDDVEHGRHLKSAEVTVFFADLAGFTAFSERADPEVVAELLEGYFTQSVDTIFSHGGTLDKFIGDCVMAFFGAPKAQPDHAQRAVRCAVEIQKALRAWNAAREAKGLPVVRARIAVNSGPVVVGDIGSKKRVDYTVLGNTVNVAARLEESVAGPGEVVVGEETQRLLVRDGAGEFRLTPLGDSSLKGLQQRIPAYRVELD